MLGRGAWSSVTTQHFQTLHFQKQGHVAKKRGLLALLLRRLADNENPEFTLVRVGALLPLFRMNRSANSVLRVLLNVESPLDRDHQQSDLACLEMKSSSCSTSIGKSTSAMLQLYAHSTDSLAHDRISEHGNNQSELMAKHTTKEENGTRRKAAATAPGKNNVPTHGTHIKGTKLWHREY